MKTMHEVAYEFLSTKETATFKQVWDFVLKTLKKSWAKNYPDISESKLEEVKVGELYTMLTTRAEFIKNQSNQWSLSEFYNYEEVVKMKINVNEKED